MTAASAVDTGEPRAGDATGVTPSPAGPASGDELSLLAPPLVRGSRALVTLRMSVRQIEFAFRARRELGETFRIHGYASERPAAVTAPPDHVRSLFTADPDDAPSVTPNSPLRPVVGPNS